MATATYDLIDSTTLTSASSSINFTSIDTATYRDLRLVIDASASISADFYPRLRFNGSTSTNYVWVSMHGTGSAVGSFYGTENGQQLGNNQFFQYGVNQLCVVDLLDAGATDKHKLSFSRIGRGGSGVERMIGRFRGNSAITSIELYSANGASLDTGSQIYLYGVVA